MVEMVSVFCNWPNCRYLEPRLGVITSHPFLIPILDRVTAEIRRQTTFRLGTLMPPLMVAQQLVSCCLHLCICPGPDTHTHTHTHTQAHACIHTHAQHGDTNTNKVHRCFRRLIRPSPAMLEVLTVCTMSCPWGSLSNFPEVFRIFSRQLEAASSIACVVVVRCRVVNVEIHGRSQSQHTGALGPRRGHPFNDRPSQGKGKK